jgi:hypothetical protein
MVYILCDLHLWIQSLTTKVTKDLFVQRNKRALVRIWNGHLVCSKSLEYFLAHCYNMERLHNVRVVEYMYDHAQHHCRGSESWWILCRPRVRLSGRFGWSRAFTVTVRKLPIGASWNLRPCYSCSTPKLFGWAVDVDQEMKPLVLIWFLVLVNIFFFKIVLIMWTSNSDILKNV